VVSVPLLLEPLFVLASALFPQFHEHRIVAQKGRSTFMLRRPLSVSFSLLLLGFGCLCAIGRNPANAEGAEEVLKARVASFLLLLVSGTDSQFEDLRQRRIVYGPSALSSSSGDAPAQDRNEGNLLGSRTFAITGGGAPGVLNKNNPFTARQILVRNMMEVGRLKEAGQHAEELARATDAVPNREADPNLAYALITSAKALLATGNVLEADRLLHRALTLEVANRLRSLPDRTRGLVGDPFSEFLGEALSEEMAPMLSGLAAVAETQNRTEEARRLHRRASELTGDADAPDVLKAFGLFEGRQHRFGKAIDLLSRSLERRREIFPLSFETADTENQLGRFALAHGQVERGYRALISAAGITSELALSGLNNPMLSSRSGDLLAFKRHIFLDVVDGAFQFGRQLKAADRSQLEAESFEAAQWAERTTAALALRRMTARVAARDAEFASLVRELEDLMSKRQQLEETLLAGIVKQDARAAEQARAQTRSLDERGNAIKTRLGERFPKYAALAYGKPVSIVETQAALGPHEALLQFAFTDDSGFAWVLTQAEARVVKLPIGRKALERDVTVLRCGLDRTGEWQGMSQDGRSHARHDACRAFRPDGLGSNELLPFDFNRAAELYQTLIAPFATVIAGKRLIIVPSGPLTKLPFQVLLAKAPDPALTGIASYRAARWLGLDHPITVLPSVGSVATLRKLPPSTANEPYLAFGNPLLDGNPNNAHQAHRAKEAREKQTCPLDLEALRQKVVMAMTHPPALAALFHRGAPNLVAARQVPPLPETRDEVCAVAKTLGALGKEEATIWLGARATETSVKALDAEARLAHYRVVHFATHGLLAGETKFYLEDHAEPALLLTPPPDGRTAAELEVDNGFLTASEVTQLHLDADWVVLSACNTAAGEIGDAEALSGLARAFFYAGARALLVSHWYVDSEATVALITNSFNALKADSKIGRAEALRSVQPLSPSNIHPRQIERGPTLDRSRTIRLP
jgi:CHAT domain-containing protein/tetratricopeptide (TPR) repeat protein